MADDQTPGPDFKNGFAIDELADGAMVLGHVDGDEVILTRQGGTLFAVGAHCTHYHGPLAEGLITGDAVRCPWHHACFSLRTGEALRAPALDPVACWRVERQGDTVFVREKLPSPKMPRAPSKSGAPAAIVIVGGGAAGLAAADMRRREGYAGDLTLLSADDSAPYDRPNLSKDFLAGTAQDDWIPLRSPDYYSERKIDLVLKARVSSLDLEGKRVQVADGASYPFESLLIATGADPVRLQIPGAADDQIHYLRTFSDSKAIIAKAASAKRVVIVGASFIGLEVAGSLRARELEVHVVAPDKQPLERVMGPEVGRFIRKLHEAHGVVFHLERTVTRVDGRKAILSDGSALEADFLVLGVGVRPSLALAEQAGLTLDHGVSVNEYLQTSAANVYAAGDIARWPDPHSGERIRVEHWVVAERQGQVAARNMLGQRVRFDQAPFFWSQHYDLALNYVGHAEKWDTAEIDGNLEAHDCTVTYMRDGRTLAVVTLSRDLENLQAEHAMEQQAV
jgi:NADPH-dependent 2,4-dienoyl-CoA reductase/sulfur reductase-like enzyme/nitrite reductase/ring-hydroxylating ferredoxin subunit